LPPATSVAGKASILIVDDDVELGRYTADVCRDAGHSATSVTAGSEALSVLRQRRYDLLISDVRMPQLDGIELMTRVKQAWPEVAMIAVTAYGSLPTAERALRAGAYEYLQKPFQPEELLTRIGRALERRDNMLELARLRSEVARRLGKP
jgi:DNA-binding NtrC family response regulator